MFAWTHTASTRVPAGLAIAFNLTFIVMPLAALAAVAGLALDGLYRETEWALPQVKGQDLVTLIAMPVLLVALLAARKGSPRGTVVWLGVLGYVLYTYTGAAFSYAFNELFLVYVALFSLTSLALICAAVGLSALPLDLWVDGRVPRKGALSFLYILAAMLTLLWLGQIAPFLIDDTVPELITRAEVPTNFVYALDLGVIVPTALIAAYLVRRRLAWGNVLAAVLMIKAATMGLALLSMTWFSVVAEQEVETELSAVWVVLAAGSIAMSSWLLRHCRAARELNSDAAAAEGASPVGPAAGARV